MLLEYQASHIQHMQKALTQMNLQLGNVISDVAGVTGLAIIRAILDGERDPLKLAALRDCRIKASEEEIAKSLHGNWREEHLFALRQAVALYDAYQARIADCDGQLAAMLSRLERHSGEPGKGRRRCRAKNAPAFDIRTALFKLCGADLTAVDGIDVSTALKVLSEIGPDLSRFKSVKHFCSWLGLCPGTKISGGKVLSGKTKHRANRVARALKLAAAALRTSQSALGAYYRRLCARMDKSKAVTAAAHKLARIIFALLTKGQAYVDEGQDYFEERYRERVLHHLKRKAQQMGFELQPVAAPPNGVKKQALLQRVGVCFLRAFRQRCRATSGSLKCVCTSLELHIMRTNIVIDDKLMQESLRATGLKTKREVVELGLKTLLRLRQQEAIRRFRGKLGWEGDLDAMRKDK